LVAEVRLEQKHSHVAKNAQSATASANDQVPKV
jgi:hypothetical protein